MLKPTLQLKLNARQAMTPQLQQAIGLLQLTAAELQQLVQDKLVDNVMLEVEDGAEAASPTAEGDAVEADTGFEDAPAEAVGDDALDVDDAWDHAALSPSGTDGSFDEDHAADFADPQTGDLRNHLLGQLLLAGLPPLDHAICAALIDALDEDGYLTDPLDALAAAMLPDVNATPADLARALCVLQTFDPSGIGAKSLSECLLLQLNQLSIDTPGLDGACRIARDHLPELAEGRRSSLRHLLGLTGAELAQAVDLIRRCHPRPGRSILSAAAEYVIPDVIVERIGRGWRVELNAAVTPRLRLNADYTPHITREHTALRGQLQEARWLIKSIEMRHDTLLRVARAIVARQSAFLDRGDEAMVPMVLREIADVVEMHESTISRVTTGKFMLTPRGTYEFRHFFSSHLSSSDGTEVSSTAIRAKIKKLIAGESPADPLSDSRIVELLADDGAKVARRTVAKYREAMQIAPSSERRSVAAR